jgi:ribonuclease P protein component
MDSAYALRRARGARSCRAVVAQGELASPLPRNPVFPREKRLSRSSLPLALRQGKRLSSLHFSVTIPSSGSGYAVIVPKKVAKLSVTRHKVKRHVLEALKTIPLPPSAVVFPGVSVAKMRYDEIVHELATLFAKIKHS